MNKKSNRISKPKAVILVGGPGMRLRPLTEDRPKSVVPVLNHPAIEYTFAYLKQYGIEDIILAVNYLPDVIQSYFGDGARCGIRLTYCLEKDPLGTAGAVKNAARYLDGTFYVLNGDLFTELNLVEMMAFHREKKAKATISLTWVEDPSRFGVVETDDDRRVKRFIEKPPLAEATSHWINAGTYILEPDVLDFIPANQHYMFENGLYPVLLSAGEPVYGYPYRGFWLDMGTPGTYFSLNSDLLMSKVASPIIPSFAPVSAALHYKSNVSIDPTAEVTPPAMIGSGCHIGKDVRLTGPAVLGRGCTLEDGTVVENSVLWDNVTVRGQAKVSHCIVCSRAVIGAGSDVKDSIVTSSGIVPLT